MTRQEYATMLQKLEQHPTFNTDDSGAKEVHRNGGTVIVQNPTNAKFPYLPKVLISSEHPDFILNPQGIADKIKETIL